MEMPQANSVQVFRYREPRVVLQLPCDFLTVAGDAIEGFTHDCSETGMRVSFQHPVLEGCRGRLRLKMESCWFEVEAEVVHSGISAAGISFVFATEAERRFLQSIVRLAARSRKRGIGLTNVSFGS